MGSNTSLNNGDVGPASPSLIRVTGRKQRSRAASEPVQVNQSILAMASPNEIYASSRPPSRPLSRAPSDLNVNIQGLTLVTPTVFEYLPPGDAGVPMSQMYANAPTSSVGHMLQTEILFDQFVAEQAIAPEMSLSSAEQFLESEALATADNFVMPMTDQFLSRPSGKMGRKRGSSLPARPSTELFKLAEEMPPFLPLPQTSTNHPVLVRSLINMPFVMITETFSRISVV
jgi:hypothetical protein